MQKNTLFGLKIYLDSADKLVSEIKNTKEKIHIISGNAEVLKYPLNDKAVFEQFNSENNIIISDGISVYYPMKLKNKKCHKIPGIELMEKLLTEFEKTGKSVYFLGAKEGIVDKMTEQFAVRFPNLKIAGFHHGYFDRNNYSDIIDDIKSVNPYAIFVAFGTPGQENFIFKHIEELPCNVFMGVGGSFDVFSGTIKRAPKWMSDLGIEWLYRIASDFSKIHRIFNNFLFTVNASIRG